MPFRIAKTFTVETGHLLTKHAGACRFPHGHSRTIEIVVAADALDANDMVCDFKTLKAAAAGVVARFDHAFAINSTDPSFERLRAVYGESVVPFDRTDPTSEVLAREIFREVQARLHAACGGGNSVPIGVRLERVRVTETATSWAEYWE